MKIGENSEDLSAGSICLSVDEAKPFQTVSIKLTVRADLQLSKDGLLFEHRVSKLTYHIVLYVKPSRLRYYRVAGFFCSKFLSASLLKRS